MSYTAPLVILYILCHFALSISHGTQFDNSISETELTSYVDADLYYSTLNKAADYFLNSLKPSSDGRFVYEQSDDGSHIRPHKHNILRVGGSIFSMAKLSQALPTRRHEIQTAAVSALDYLYTNYIHPVDAEGSFPSKQGTDPNRPLYAVVSKRSEEGGKKGRRTAKSGGAGLALVATCSLADAGMDISPYMDTARGLGDFLLRLTNNKGVLASKYDLKAGKTDKSFVSLYYPGEAALGLLMLCEIDREGGARFCRGAETILLQLARSRKGLSLGKVPPDHWSLIATWKAAQMAVSTPLNSRKLRVHAAQVSRRILRSFNWAADPAREPAVEEHMVGGFRGGADNRCSVCSAATRMEGLAAAAALLSSDASEQDLVRTIIRALPMTGAFLVSNQYRGGAVGGGFRAVCTGSSPVRIDYTQHAVCALMTAEEVVPLPWGMQDE